MPAAEAKVWGLKRGWKCRSNNVHIEENERKDIFVDGTNHGRRRLDV